MAGSKKKSEDKVWGSHLNRSSNRSQTGKLSTICNTQQQLLRKLMKTDVSKTRTSLKRTPSSKDLSGKQDQNVFPAQANENDDISEVEVQQRDPSDRVESKDSDTLPNNVLVAKEILTEHQVAVSTNTKESAEHFDFTGGVLDFDLKVLILDEKKVYRPLSILAQAFSEPSEDEPVTSKRLSGLSLSSEHMCATWSSQLPEGNLVLGDLVAATVVVPDSGKRIEMFTETVLAPQKRKDPFPHEQADVDDQMISDELKDNFGESSDSKWNSGRKRSKLDILESKMKRGKLNENFVKIDLKKKIYVRGKKSMTGEKFRRQKWKNKFGKK